MSKDSQSGIRETLANAGKEPTGRFKELADRLIRTLPKPTEPKK